MSVVGLVVLAALLVEALAGSKGSPCKGAIERLGSSEGGWEIRTADDRLDGPFVVYSIGLADDTSFDEEILERFEKAEVYGFDPTPTSKAYTF
ncbi:unnamed protein product [Vitrella brassicaformis CCMP3155]|uniref:Uncharacterized protein n=1 Tax=Vitrella brassicaformis (strain CCMP3155) TaxID=1169540 RepID=A0A0G4GN43_VITBC|nr:unnamed protein product [Vitrella brassicaformis CCMP3155]|eukprot:CEM31622.1 unnamed protein product [Vitrella brassicaformis CCMP3155]